MRDWRTIPCPIERTATLLADHYTIMIVRDLVEEPRRFTDLERAGINPRTLSARLEHLEREGFVCRGLGERGRHPYMLTDKGRALVPLIAFLRDYGQAWLPVPDPQEPAGPAAEAGRMTDDEA